MNSISAARSSYLMPSEMPKEPKRSHSTEASKRSPWTSRMIEIAARAAAVPVDSHEASAPCWRRNNAMSAADASGRRRIRMACESIECMGRASVLQGVQFLDLHRVALAEEGHDDGQAEVAVGLAIIVAFFR